MADEIVDLVDEANNVVGRATRREVRERNLLHRGVGILCRNPRGEVFVHRRTDTKDVFPGMYDMFVGGVVAAGEEYAQAARREVTEELGVTGGDLRHLFDHLYLGPSNRSWVAVYEVEWAGPVHLQASEVAWGAYFTPEALQAKLAEWTFVPDGVEIYERYLQWRVSQVGSGPGTGNGGDGGSPPRNR